MPDNNPPEYQQPPSETTPTTLSAKQHLALQALLLHHSVKDAAQAAKVGESTIRRWLADDEEFRTDYWRACRRLLDQAVGLLHLRASQAVSVLHEISEDKKAPYNSRIAASCALIELSLKGVNYFAAEEIQVRYEASERKSRLTTFERLKNMIPSGCKPADG